MDDGNFWISHSLIETNSNYHIIRSMVSFVVNNELMIKMKIDLGNSNGPILSKLMQPPFFVDSIFRSV